MRWVAVAVLALAAAGCGGSGVHVIAWTGQRPSVAPAPALARPCRASDLKLRPLEGEWSGAGGDLVNVIRVTNVSRSSCLLLGRPTVGFTRATTTNDRMAPLGHDNLDSPPPSSLRALAPGKSAVSDLIWHQSWCGIPPKAILVGLEDGSPLTTPNNTAPRCDEIAAGRSASALVSDSDWVPAGGAGPPPVPLRATLLGPTRTVALLGPIHPAPRVRDAVYRVRRGSVLHYEVALTNISSHPFAFTRCPLFTVDVGARTEVYVLNCRPADTLAPGKRAVFAMQMKVNGPIGGFLWQLDAANAPGAHAEVVVTG